MTATEVKTLSRGQKVAAEVSALLRARNPLIWIITREESRVESFLIEAAASAGYSPLFWDVGQGVTDLSSKPVKLGANDCGETLTAIKSRADDTTSKDGFRNVWIMRDLPVWLGGGLSGAAPLRQLRNLAKYLPGVQRKNAQAVIILTTETKVPDDLAGHATVIDWPLPDRSEIAAVLDAAVNALAEYEIDKETGEPNLNKPLRALAAPGNVRDLAIDAAVGLTAEEAAACYAKSLVQTKKIDPAVVSAEKKRVIARERVLEWVEPVKGGLDAVGGLDQLKTWLVSRENAFSPAAREYGLPAPKGAVLVGVTGCGKSLLAKCTATAWEVPLLRLDLGALKGKYVGQSEGNIRKAFSVIEAIGRCVLWIDEIEKAMAGSSSGASDGGVSADALGVVLNWMQERTSEAFVIATANDVSSLPPELLRKGRFDEVFFVDLPVTEERKAVLKTALRAHGRDKIKIDLNEVATVTEGFTGAEIAELVPSALFTGFADGAREITTADILAAAKDVHPVSKSAEKKITVLRDWAREHARPATTKVGEVAKVGGGGARDLDL